MGGTDLADPGAQWDGHVLLVHATEADRVAGLAAWVRRGLQLGEKVLYTETPAEPAGQVLSALESGSVDVGSACGEGRLQVVPLQEVYPPPGQRAVAERALSEGFPAVRISAGALPASPGLGPAALRDFEARLDELVRTRPVSVLCQYARSPGAAAPLGQAVAMHLAGVREAALATADDEHGLILRGEVDATNRDLFTAVVSAAVDAATSTAVCLDLAGVDHLDAGSCWGLDDATRRFRSAGGQLLLVAPQPMVERVLWMLEVDQLPGITLVGGDR